jgi:putative acetyltransferase
MLLVKTNSKDKDFRELVALLNEGLVVTDGEDFDFFFQYNQLDTIKHVIVAYENEVATGCGAIKEYEEDTAEIKRMFVREDFRGRRIAAEVLAALEDWAAELGYKKCILETSTALPSAIRLYEREGYTRIPNYGQYIGVASSVCMMKNINQ